MSASRRTVLKAGAASGASLLARPALAQPLGPAKEFATSRQSRVVPGTALVHADLHNHTLYSDGAGDPAAVFDSMRAAGLDVAALTDHTTTIRKALGAVEQPCPGNACRGAEGIHEARWAATSTPADDANSDQLIRAGVREAMLARRFFSTRLRGLRFGAAANGRQMGSAVPHRNGPVRFTVDVDRDPAFVGQSLDVQVLMTGSPVPRIVHTERITIPPGGQLLTFEAPVDVEDGRWVVLRLTDPTQPADARAPAEYGSSGGGIAYAAPFFLEP